MQGEKMHPGQFEVVFPGSILSQRYPCFRFKPDPVTDNPTMLKWKEIICY